MQRGTFLLSFPSFVIYLLSDEFLQQFLAEWICWQHVLLVFYARMSLLHLHS